mmetsp:Transcript_6626/g.10436  ORF Transcript_6626/g.10436 Transcript_6626/m.10436 type:complete len:335 (+) Transcript_6626:241-1245(+)
MAGEKEEDVPVEEQSDNEELSKEEKKRLKKEKKKEKKEKKEKKKRKKEATSDVDENERDSEVESSKKVKKQKVEPAVDETVDDDDANSIGSDIESEGEVERFTVYVEGIPYEYKEEELWTLFGTCGTVVDIRLPRWNDTGRLRGYAHVDFETSDEAKKCIEKLNRHSLGSRYITVSEANARGGSRVEAKLSNLKPEDVPDTCTTIFVKNLPYDTDEDVVEEAFASFGKVVNVRLTRWNHTGKLKGIGYVQFGSVKGVRAVLLAKDPIQIGERTIQVDADIKGRPKSSFKDSTGRQWSKSAGRQIRNSGAGGRGGRGRGRGGGRGRGRGRGGPRF